MTITIPFATCLPEDVSPQGWPSALDVVASGSYVIETTFSNLDNDVVPDIGRTVTVEGRPFVVQDLDLAEGTITLVPVSDVRVVSTPQAEVNPYEQMFAEATEQSPRGDS